MLDELFGTKLLSNFLRSNKTYSTKNDLSERKRTKYSLAILPKNLKSLSFSVLIVTMRQKVEYDNKKLPDLA